MRKGLLGSVSVAAIGLINAQAMAQTETFNFTLSAENPSFQGALASGTGSLTVDLGSLTPTTGNSGFCYSGANGGCSFQGEGAAVSGSVTFTGLDSSFYAVTSTTFASSVTSGFNVWVGYNPTPGYGWEIAFSYDSPANSQGANGDGLYLKGWNPDFVILGTGPTTNDNYYTNTCCYSGNLSGFNISNVNVPEPTSMVLFGSAMAGLSALRRRKRTVH